MGSGSSTPSAPDIKRRRAKATAASVSGVSKKIGTKGKNFAKSKGVDVAVARSRERRTRTGVLTDTLGRN